MTAGPILTINAGSSTVKLDAFDLVGAEEEAGSEAERTLHRTLELGDGDPAGHLATFASELDRPPQAVVHRIVHGGHAVTGPAIADEAVETAIRDAVPLAPLHNPRGVEMIAAARQAWPEARQIVVPDTGFFAALPAHASRYALPRALSDELCLRRFGFHGIAHSSMLHVWSDARPDGLAGTRVISLQIGSGCSIAASRDGHPVDTSMGFTPLEGLVMATRSGDVDPGLLIYLMREHGYSADDLDRLLNRESGLLGLAGSGDSRAVLEAGTAEADEAVAIYCYRIAKYVGAYLAALGGADAILFGGGVGEHSAMIRARILDRFAWAGIALDGQANSEADTHHGAFHAAGSTSELHVIAVDEAAEMLRLAGPLLG